MAQGTTTAPGEDASTDGAPVLRSPALDAQKAAYLRGGLGDVEGWLIPSTALYLAGIETAQRRRLEGGVCEIGVHRGKSFLAMAIDSPVDMDAVAIDIFDLQHLNEDGRSRGAREAFEAHLEEWGLGTRVEVVEGSSLDLEDDDFLEAGPRFRLVSVDGGHTSEIVRNDLFLAEKTTVPGGIVAVDDFLNAHWLGVCTGVFDYFHDAGTLRPFALIPNKLLLCDPEHLAENRAMLSELFPAGLSKAGVPLLDVEIDVYADVDWTVVGVDGSEGKLFRPASDVNSLRAELTGTRLELRRVRREKREAIKDNRSLRKQLRATRRQKSRVQDELAEARDSGGQVSPIRTVPERFSDALPSTLQAPARRIYRWTKRRSKPHSGR